MALLYIRQYTRLATDTNGQTVLAGLEPGLDLAPVAIGAGTNVALASGTKFVRLHSDAVCSYVCGLDSSAAATTSNARLAANQTEFFGISSAVTYIAVIGNT